MSGAASKGAGDKVDIEPVHNIALGNAIVRPLDYGATAPKKSRPKTGASVADSLANPSRKAKDAQQAVDKPQECTVSLIQELRQPVTFNLIIRICDWLGCRPSLPPVRKIRTTAIRRIGAYHGQFENWPDPEKFTISGAYQLIADGRRVDQALF